MATEQADNALRQLRKAIPPAHVGTIPDAQLLARFVRHRDEAAFELLVWRHGPMVLSVCRRVLRDAWDVDDAFQATFLTLVRRAGSIGKRESVSSWLYTVAYRVALRARGRAARRSARQEGLGGIDVAAAAPGPDTALAWREVGPVLDAEVQRLPEKYRAAFVLCCLEGKTNEEAARELGCPKGTVLSRLARARERLRRRLSDRGLLLSVVPFALLLTRHAAAQAALPPALVTTTVQGGMLLALGKPAAAA